jgi:hypothetical protein
MKGLLTPLRYLWALPVTAVGLVLALLATVSGGSARVRGGVVEAHGGLVARFLRGGRWWHGGAAMAVGHVILARDADCLARSRSHELGHVRQFERWGPLLLPVYWGIGGWLALRGFHPYLDHPFEQPGSRSAED